MYGTDVTDDCIGGEILGLILPLIKKNG